MVRRREAGSVKRQRPSRAQGVVGGGVYCGHDAGCDCDAAAAADVRGFALPEASVEGGAVGGGSSLIDPADVVVQVRWDAGVDDAQVGSRSDVWSNMCCRSAALLVMLPRKTSNAR